MKRTGVQVAMVLAAAISPLLFVWSAPDLFLADPLSELPVKLWGWDTFALDSGKFLGGVVDTISFPHGGELNNPDLIGTVLMGILGPLTGSAMAYNLMVVFLLAANGLSAWALTRHLLGNGQGQVISGVSFALTPLALTYGMGGAITDLLNLWPYPLTLLLTLKALRNDASGILSGWAHGIGAGVVLGLGFVTCVYNFVVFSPMAILAAIWLPVAWKRGLSPSDASHQKSGGGTLLRRTVRVGIHLGIGFALTGGIYAGFLLGIMDAESSQMSTELVGSVRHSPPFQELSLAGQDRYVAHLLDYVRSWDAGLITRDNASRFNWAFHPGWIIYALTLIGLWAHRKRLTAVVLWPVMAVVFALLSTGPYLIVSDAISFDTPKNYLWLAVFNGLPGSAMLLEPFRYGLVVGMALSVSAGLGAQVVARRFGPWAIAVLAAGIGLEIALISPTPVPPPTTQMAADDAYAELGDRLPQGAIIELPYFHTGTGLFQRRHFLNQQRHGRPIPNPVFGMAPPVLVGNPLTFALLHEEQVPDRFMPRTQVPPGTLESGARELVSHGFSAIVVNPSLYSDRATQKRVRRMLRSVGHVEEHSGLWVVSL